MKMYKEFIYEGLTYKESLIMAIVDFLKLFYDDVKYAKPYITVNKIHHVELGGDDHYADIYFIDYNYFNIPVDFLNQYFRNLDYVSTVWNYDGDEIYELHFDFSNLKKFIKDLENVATSEEVQEYLNSKKFGL